MKIIYIALLCSALMSITASAQNISADKVPASVIKSFKAKFPSAENVKWELENKNEYEAVFKTKGVEQSASFEMNGKWMETETEMKISELSAEIQKSVTKNYAGYKIDEASKVESAQHGNCYEVKVEKAKESFEVMMKSKGEIISKKSEKEDKEDKD